MAPDSSWIARIVFPFGPIISPIFSGLIWIDSMRGAYVERSSRAPDNVSPIQSKMCIRAVCARPSASSRISTVKPAILISIWMEVIPSRVPATLKSMSPSASSSPRISVRIATSSSSFIKPIATPAQADLIGTPASISERDDPHTVAIDEEPFDSRISDTMRIV